MPSPITTPRPAVPSSTGILTPSSTPAARFVTSTVLHLNQMQMNTLIAQGIQLIQPHNGPDDGEPLYKVPATPATLALLSRKPITQHDTQDEQCIDPLLLRPAPWRSGQHQSKK